MARTVRPRRTDTARPLVESLEDRQLFAASLAVTVSGPDIVQVNRQSFVDAVQKNFDLTSQGYTKADYDKIVAIK